MKPYLLILSLGLMSVTLSAQSVDYNKIIVPDHITGVSIEERLVQLAWKNHPNNKILFNNADIAKREKNIAGAEWLNIIRVSGNLNEFTISNDYYDRVQGAQGTNSLAGTQFPRYNIGAFIPLGIFMTIPNSVKRARQNQQIAQHNIEAQKLALRKEVLTLYNEYKMHDAIFKIRSSEEVEATTTFSMLEQKFKAGEESYERYTNSLTVLNRIKIDKIQAQTAYQNAQLSLEEFIGVKLETAIEGLK